MTQNPTKSPAVSERDNIARIIAPSAWDDRGRYIAIMQDNGGCPMDTVMRVSDERGDIRSSRSKADAILARLAPAPDKVVREADLIEALDYAISAVSKEADHAMKVTRAARYVIEEIEERETRFKKIRAALAQPEAARVGGSDDDWPNDAANAERYLRIVTLAEDWPDNVRREAVMAMVGWAENQAFKAALAQPEAARVAEVSDNARCGSAISDTGRELERLREIETAARNVMVNTNGHWMHPVDMMCLRSALGMDDDGSDDPDAATGCGDDLGLFAQPNMDEQPEAARVGDLRQALEDCADALARFAHSTLLEDKHIQARKALNRAAMALATPAPRNADETGQDEALREEGIIEVLDYAIAAVGKEADHAMKITRAARYVVEEIEERETRFKKLRAAFQSKE